MITPPPQQPPPHPPIQVHISANRTATVAATPTPDDLAIILTAQSVSNDFRAHLLRRQPDGTQSPSIHIYHQVLTEVYDTLKKRDRNIDITLPTIHEVATHLKERFPHVWVGAGQLGLWDHRTWGQTRTEWRDKIMVWREPLIVLQKRTLGIPFAKSGEDFFLSQIYHLVATILAHEVMHHLVRVFFPAIVTPRGVGPMTRVESKGYGESGHRLEKHLFGGSLIVEWHKDHQWDLAHLHELLFQVRPGETYVISDTRDVVAGTSAHVQYDIEFDNGIRHIGSHETPLRRPKNARGIRSRIEIDVTGPPSPTEMPPVLVPAQSPDTDEVRIYPPGVRY